MADDPNAPKTYRRPSANVAPATTAHSAPAVVAADPNAPSTYKRPGAGQPEPVSPDPNAYKPPDWIPGAGFLYKTNRIFENALLGGATDYLTAKAGDLARSVGIQNKTPSVAQLHAETKQDRADVGPVASTIADTAGYVMGPGRVLGPLAGKLAPVAGRYGAAAVEGAMANTVDAFGNHLGSDQPLNWWDTGKHIVAGGLTGVGGQAVGDVTAPLVRRVMDYTHGLPGRGAEQWDWRIRAATGEDVRPDIEDWRARAPPASITPERNAAIDKTIGALGQSTEPGSVAHIGTGAAAATAAKFGLTPYLDQLSNFADLSGLGAGGASYLSGNPVARSINTIDRNINVGQSLDQLYPALTGRQSTTDVSDWANALRRLGIGSQATPSGP